MNREMVAQMEARSLETLVKLAVGVALEQAGLSDGYKNFSECRRIYGKWFVDHAKKGHFQAVKRGNRKMYSVTSINALMAVESINAAKRAAYLRPEPDIL